MSGIDGAPAVIIDSSAYKLPLEIFRRKKWDFITPEEVTATRGLIYPPDMVERYIETVNDQAFEDVLKYARKNRFVVMPGPPEEMSFTEVHALGSGLFDCIGREWPLEDRQKFAREEKVSPGVIIFRKGIVPGSIKKEWWEQKALLSSEEYIPNAVEETYVLTTYKKVRGIFLLPRVYVRTSSVAADSTAVSVGYTNNTSLVVYYFYRDISYNYVGVSSFLEVN